VPFHQTGDTMTDFEVLGITKGYHSDHVRKNRLRVEAILRYGVEIVDSGRDAFQFVHGLGWLYWFKDKNDCPMTFTENMLSAGGRAN
jgi:hypothetical protein